MTVAAGTAWTNACGDGQDQHMSRQGVVTTVLVGLYLSGCTSNDGATVSQPRATGPQPISVEQALKCGGKGLVRELNDAQHSNVEWKTDEEAAIGLAGQPGSGTTAKPWTAVSSLPTELPTEGTEWLVYDAAGAPLALVDVTRTPDAIVNSTNLPIGHFGGGVAARCQV